MPTQQLTVVQAPFQNKLDITSLLTPATSTDISFVNNGFTTLYVIASSGTPTVTVKAVPDNSGRLVDIAGALTAAKLTSYGPLRPSWWNYAGVVRVTLSATANVSLCAVSYKY